jgi:hypothetical protein
MTIQIIQQNLPLTGPQGTEIFLLQAGSFQYRYLNFGFFGLQISEL